MNIALHTHFLESLAILSKADQKRVREMITHLGDDPALPGLRVHKVGAFTSLSAGMAIRAIAYMRNSDLTLVHVGQHDDVYRWAERTRCFFGKDGQFLGLVATDHPLQSDLQLSPSTTSGFIDPRVLSELDPTLRNCLTNVQTEDDLLRRLEFLAPEHQEAVLEAIYSKTPVQLEQPSNIVFLTDDKELETAMIWPFDKWRVFLHPKQRFVVSIPADRDILLKGGPGTGKTITLIHRFVSLACGKVPPLFLAPNTTTAEIIKELLDKKGVSSLSQYVCLSAGLPKSKPELAAYLAEYSAIFVDEGQDLATDVIAAILEVRRLGYDIPPLCIGYDANQSIHTASSGAIERFQAQADVIRLTYNYRTTAQILEAAASLVEDAHKNFRGKDFIVQSQIDNSRDKATATSITALSGPRVEHWHTSTYSEIETFLERMLSVAAVDMDSSLAVLVIGRAADQDAWNRLRQRSQARCFWGGAADAKGREFRIGCVLTFRGSDAGQTEIRGTMSQYRLRIQEYVCVSRFRERVTRIDVKEKNGEG